MTDPEKELMDLCTKALVGDNTQTVASDNITYEEITNKIKVAIAKLDKITPVKVNMVAGKDAYMSAEHWLFDHGYGYRIPAEPPIRLYNLTLWRSKHMPPDAVIRLPELDPEDLILLQKLFNNE